MVKKGGSTAKVGTVKKAKPQPKAKTAKAPKKEQEPEVIEEMDVEVESPNSDTTGSKPEKTAAKRGRSSKATSSTTNKRKASKEIEDEPSAKRGQRSGSKNMGKSPKKSMNGTSTEEIEAEPAKDTVAKSARGKRGAHKAESASQKQSAKEDTVIEKGSKAKQKKVAPPTVAGKTRATKIVIEHCTS